MLNIFFIISVICFSILLYLMKTGEINDALEGLIDIINFIFCFLLIASLIIMFILHIGASANIKETKEEYKNLCWQVNKVKYDYRISLGEQRILEQVKEWNEDLAYNQNIQKDFWLGCYFPNIYDQFEFIEYDNGGENER